MATPLRSIFVSYRRSDSSDVTGRIFDRLQSRFGEARLFKDVDSIPLGRDFRAAITDAIEHCAVALVIVGRDWSTVQDNAGKRRIDDNDDYVHIEVATALRRNIPVIPVLVGKFLDAGCLRSPGGLEGPCVSECYTGTAGPRFSYGRGASVREANGVPA